LDPASGFYVIHTEQSQMVEWGMEKWENKGGESKLIQNQKAMVNMEWKCGHLL